VAVRMQAVGQPVERVYLVALTIVPAYIAAFS
jgi:hypothetical protein